MLLGLLRPLGPLGLLGLAKPLQPAQLKILAWSVIKGFLCGWTTQHQD
jgi:hypothetical protein